MPKQELFFQQEAEGRQIEVLKTYDQQFAREAFDEMKDDAQARLWTSLNPEEIYDPAGLPSATEPEDRSAFLWDELVEQAREDWQTFSFFIVSEKAGTHSENLYVSPDWPSAEAFAKSRISAIQ